MAKKDAQVIDIIIRFDERDDGVNVAILGGNLSFDTIYKILDRARLDVQAQERNVLIERLSGSETEVQNV